MEAAATNPKPNKLKTDESENSSDDEDDLGDEDERQFQGRIRSKAGVEV